MSFLDKIREFFDSIVHHDDQDYATVREHRVVKGDTLWGIVRHVTGATDTAEIQRHVDEVKKLNPDVDPDLIMPGDELKLPLSWCR